MKNNKKGFTLIELTLAVIIFAWIVYMLVGVFNNVARTVTVNESKGKISEELRQASQLMHDEMKFATVRTNVNRFLNMKVYENMWASEDDVGVYIYFCAPVNATNDLNKAQGIQHLCYFFDKATSNVYRAIYEHASSETTLAYQSQSDPYAWILQMSAARQRAKGNPPLLSRVAYFKALLYTNTPIASSIPLTNQWTNSDKLPLYMRLQVGIQEDQREKTNNIRNFFIEVPMLHREVNDLNKN